NRLEFFFHQQQVCSSFKSCAHFTNTKLEQFDGVKPYCTRLKTLADSLRNVGDKVSDNQWLQLLKGLSEAYKPFHNSVRHLNPLPFFDTLRSMLELEEQGNASDLAIEAPKEAHLSHIASPISQSHGDTNFAASKGGIHAAKARVGKVTEQRQRWCQQEQPAATSITTAATNNSAGVELLNSSSKARGGDVSSVALLELWTLGNPSFHIPISRPRPKPVARGKAVPTSPQPGILKSHPPQAYFSSSSSSSSGLFLPTLNNKHTMSLAEQNYYMDAEATSHMTNSPGNLSLYFNSSNHIIMRLLLAMVVKYRLKVMFHECLNQNSLQLTNVLHVPKLINLISV
ncbi:Leucine--tRNA ligase, partial [Bienertia sinuspersici]